MTATASFSSSGAPELATITGSTTSGTPRPAREAATTSMIPADSSIPVLTASAPMSANTASTWAVTKSVGTAWIAVTAVVF